MVLYLGRTERIKRLSPAGEYNCICDLDKRGADPRGMTTILLVSLISAAAPQSVNEQIGSGWVGIFRNTPYLTDHRTCSLLQQNHRVLAVFLRHCKPAVAGRRRFHPASRPMMPWDGRPSSGSQKLRERRSHDPRRLSIMCMNGSLRTSTSEAPTPRLVLQKSRVPLSSPG